MSSDRFDEIVAVDRLVAEYLRELEQRLSGLPVLQRRELLGDLEAHIVNERAERGVSSEMDLMVVLERLGSPEVVAAAAYEEAGLPEPTVQLTPVGAAPRAGGGTVTAAASARFTGRAERTAAVDSAEVVAAVARVSAPPAWVPPAPAPQAYAPPAPAAVVPPPDDLLRDRPGPFPPSGPGRPAGLSPVSAPGGGHGFGSGPGAGRWSNGGPPPFVGGPPLPPPPRRTAAAANPWTRAVLGGAIGLVVLFVLGCLGAGAFLLQSGETSDAPAAVVEQVPPVDTPVEPAVPPAPEPTE